MPKKAPAFKPDIGQIINGIILLGYCIPYPFVAMSGDINNRTMVFYVVMLLCLGVLCAAAAKRQIIRYAVAGSVLSAVISYICVCYSATEEWLWYFKPLTPNFLSIAISAAALIVQSAVWFIISKKRIPMRRKAEE